MRGGEAHAPHISSQWHYGTLFPILCFPSFFPNIWTEAEAEPEAEPEEEAEEEADDRC
jgi:hypothetical protein